ncbi:helix-turn-helix domain-containing protein [Streptomyces sp. NPDC046977]|uniref:helix-turn-helix domain-containing protein n=1 Tax=Streptomyces sp. NPDC046977 TaxID=3154703 RepID=UPI0033E6F603
MNTTSEPLAADPEIVRGFLATHFAGDAGLVAVSSTRDWTGIQTADLDRAAQWALAEDRAGAEGIYARVTTIGSRLPPGSRGTARDSRALIGMWSDIDYGNAGHKTTGLPETADEARDIPRFAKLPEPTEVHNSGGGLYAWWKFNRPLVVGEDIEFDTAVQLAADWQNILKLGATQMGLEYGTGVKDLARVLRLPGSVNRKPGRTPAMCRIVEQDGPRYALDDMLQLATQLKPKPKKRTPPPKPAPKAGSSRSSGETPLYAGPGPLQILGDHACAGDILTFAGATYHEQYPGTCSYCGPDCQRWLRPGWGTGNSIDGIAVHKGGAAVTIRTDNFPGFPDEFVGRVLSSGQLFAALHHRGDESAAAKDILRAAHGNPEASPAANALPAPVLAEIRQAGEARYQFGVPRQDRTDAPRQHPDEEPVEEETEEQTGDKDREPTPEEPAATSDSHIDQLREDFLDQLKTYVHLTSDRHIKFSLAVSVSSELDGDPLWGMLVGPPSGGKTEAIKCLDGIADEYVDDITGPALLSWMPGKNPRPTGILTRIPSRAFVSISDFSTVLATSDRGGRDTLFALLRRAYDGHVVREVGNSPQPLTWTGRLTLLAAVTPAIDNFSSHTDALGPRWLYCRLPDTDNRHKKATVRKRRTVNGIEQLQAEARRRAALLVRAARDRVRDIELDDDMYDQLEDAAMLTCLGRAAVPRHAYGRREIDGIPVIEEPARVTGQIVALAKSLLALGVPRDEVLAIAGQCALDTVPQARLACLQQLANGEALTVSEIRRLTGLHRHVARRALEDMEVVELTRCQRDEKEEESEDTGFPASNPWALGEEAELVVSVLRAQRTSERASEGDEPPLARNVGSETPTPQKREDLDQEKGTSEAHHRGAAHTSCQGEPAASPAPPPEPPRPRAAPDDDLWGAPLDEPDDYYAEAG